jgi:hypothetical protein
MDLDQVHMLLFVINAYRFLQRPDILTKPQYTRMRLCHLSHCKYDKPTIHGNCALDLIHPHYG